MNNMIIEINHLSYSYGKQKIISDISMEIKNNSIVFLMGNNGSGKTTLLRCIMNHLSDYQGSIMIGHNMISRMKKNYFAKQISYVPQNININCTDLKVKDYLILGRSPYITLGNPKKHDYEVVEYYSKHTRILDILEVPFGALSGGQKQWVAITRALVQETPIIVMDEPMSALDMGRQADCLELIERLKTDEGKTILLTSHNPNHCMAVDSEVCLLHEQRILAYGDPKDVFSAQNINDVYGKKIKFIDNKYVGFSKINE